jgi:hypothetical protein
MTRQEKLAYSRGYQRGMHRAWGDHLPPLPPVEELQKLLAAAQKIRDQADYFCASIDPEDEWVATLGQMIDGFDEAMQEFKDWMEKQ